MIEKYASEYPLPGGVEQYAETLFTLLRLVGEKPRNPEALVQLFRETCANATGSTAINGYINAIVRMGFWALKDGAYRLTSQGTSLLVQAEDNAQAAYKSVLSAKLAKIAGYDFLLKHSLASPQTFDAIDADLKKRLKVTWSSKNQTMFRINWLRSLGYVERDCKVYRLTDAGTEIAGSLLALAGDGNADAERRPPRTLVEPRRSQAGLASELADRVDQAAVSGGDGTALEMAVADAFQFLGFETQLIGGSGNPDIVVSAPAGQSRYTVLVETKSRSSGSVNQNDINFNALIQHKTKSNADFVLVVAADFAGGNLEQWAAENDVRLFRTEELRQLLLAYEEAVIPLDQLRQLFIGGGSTDESMLSNLLAESEGRLQLTSLARQVYFAIHSHQEEEALLNENSLFYIFGSQYSIADIEQTVELLESNLLAAVGRTSDGSLFCRLAPHTLRSRLAQIQQIIGENIDSSRPG